MSKIKFIKNPHISGWLVRGWLRRAFYKYYVDEFYERWIIGPTAAFARGVANILDRILINGLFVWTTSALVYLVSLFNQLIDEIMINQQLLCSPRSSDSWLNRIGGA